MAYLVTRRIGKHLYRYEVESYWDSTKKQSRQRILRFVLPPVRNSPVFAGLITPLCAG